ncbi:hypothetical protein GH714_009812 [Hevea brasiliensis]|uniref:Sulfotransferase n=1 Tax=Hevea brasiliensis TaxID=3981 RepID=A0A6A6L0K5_HEVBR|nr:hypothetical protein GH714_009812 [Hevea brasiliensis]
MEMEPSSIFFMKSDVSVPGPNQSPRNHTKYKEIIATLPRKENVLGAQRDSYIHEYQGYWKASLEFPERMLFIKYEDLMNDTFLYVKRIAEFMGCPFSAEEERQGFVKKVVDMCSFETLRNLEVNKGKVLNSGTGPFKVENNAFFRKGKVGDWKKYLTAEMGAQLDQITEQKLIGSGLSSRAP